jgi:hypothetical protein
VPTTPFTHQLQLGDTVGIQVGHQPCILPPSHALLNHAFCRLTMHSAAQPCIA